MAEDEIEQQQQTPPAAGEIAPDAERVEIDLPEELRPPPEEGAEPETPTGEAEVTPAEEVEAAPPGPAPRRTVDKGALDAERERRKEAQERYREAEAARQRYAAEVARLRAEHAARQQPAQPKYDEMGSMTEAIDQYHKQVVEPLVRSQVMQVRQQLLAERVARSEAAFVPQHKDYYEVLAKSGVQEAISLDPYTGQWRDPFLAQLFYSDANPAEAAYQYGLGRLAEARGAEAEVRGESKGRKEVIRQLVKNAERPKGIAGLASSSEARTGLTRRDLDRMPDAQRERVFALRPELRDWWLGG